jgi:vitamin-K-epoxide reductase (warfarin-sensitive)
MPSIFHFCFIGICLSLYALFVEYKAGMDSSYVALCDISEDLACSKVFLSKYGRIWSALGVIPDGSALDLPNSVYGVAFYSTYALLCWYRHSSGIIPDILLALSVVSMVLSTYLSYILTYVLEDVCVVCYSTYLINFIIFLFSITLIAPQKSKAV